MSSDQPRISQLNRNRIQIVNSLVANYDGSEPFHQYLKKYFRANRGFGSTDRRLYRQWSYAYWRLGKALTDVDFTTRLSIANFLVNGSEGFPFDVSGISEQIGACGDPSSLQSRIDHIRTHFPQFRISEVFPFSEKLSEGISNESYALSMLRQPAVFIRLVASKQAKVKEELNKSGIRFRGMEESPLMLELESGVNLEELRSFQNGWLEVQDRSSQLAGMQIPAVDDEKWWDCCCGAGGKSLQLLDRVPGVHLTVSDKRSSILEQFFSRYQIKSKHPVQSKVIDLETGTPPFPENTFDGILADVPCSGSGTWSRTPEWLAFFKEADVESYAARQRAIVEKAVPCLKPGGTLVYITCSVFSKENEDNIDWMQKTLNLSPVHRMVIPGTESRSDSMFYAILKKS